VAWGVAVPVVTWDIHPRNADLSRTFDPLSRWQSLTLVERHNTPDAWTLTGPASVLSVFEPGMGCILDRDGEQITSGQLRSVRRWTDRSSRDQVELGFASDLAGLGGRVVQPTPGHVLSEGVSTFPDAYDARSGTVEDLILAYIDAHIGSGALVDRRLTSLVLPASLVRGGATSVTARFDNLGVLVQSLAEAGRLRVTVEHDETGGPHLALRITPVPDVSDNVRFGPAGSIATGLVTEQSFEIAAPTLTRAVVIAGGELENRAALRVVDEDAEALWNTVIEQTIDQRQTVEPAEMLRAAHEALDEGAGTVKVSFTVADGPDVQYRRDYAIGYRVGVDLEGLPDAVSDNVIREVTTTVSNQSGEPTERIQVVVGTPDASNQQTKSARQVAKALRRVTAIERST
jgi:hypothetical protein